MGQGVKSHYKPICYKKSLFYFDFELISGLGGP